MYLPQTILAFIVVAAASGLPGVACAQSITLDGQTATSLRSGVGGRIEIDIATPNSGVSVNSFEKFDVPAQGAAFDNTSKGASAIVADVTGRQASRIEGTLEVLGGRADVIVANPNGFELNGARFQNMRGLALIAGQRRPGTLSYDVRPGDGGINVGPGGVVADVRRMDLIARTIRIGGNIGESGASPYLRFDATAGTGTATIDPNVSGVDADGYMMLSGRGQLPGEAVSLTLTDGAMVSGGKLTLTADARGAGVVMAGQGLASAGEFTMSADGRIALKGATVKGLTDVRITGGSIEAERATVTSDLNDVAMAATVGQTLTDTGITAANVSLSAGQGITVNGGKVEAQQDLTLASQSLTLNTRDAANMAIMRAQQNATLSLGGDFVNNTGLVQAYGDLDITVGGTLANLLNTDTRNEPIAGFNLATLQADGNARIRAGHLYNAGGLLRGTGSLTLTGGTVTNKLKRLGQIERKKSCFLFLCRSHASGAYRFSGGGIETNGDLNVDLTGDFRNYGGTVSSMTGLTMRASAIDFQPLRYSDWYSLPKGPSTLFFGQRTRRFSTYETGKLYANGFRFSLTAQSGLVRFVGTEVFPGYVLASLDGKAEIVAVPEDVIKANGKGFGVFSGVLD